MPWRRVSRISPASPDLDFQPWAAVRSSRYSRCIIADPPLIWSSRTRTPYLVDCHVIVRSTEYSVPIGKVGKYLGYRVATSTEHTGRKTMPELAELEDSVR